MDGRKVSDETQLSQGSMLTVGKSNYLRFNNPAEAELLRSAIGSKEHIPMPHIDFTQDDTSSTSSSANHSPADLMLSSDSAHCTNNTCNSIMDTVRKAEFPNNINNFHSPKVFAADSLTLNTPAKDVLGSKFNNFTKNMAHMFGNNHKSIPNLTNNNLVTGLAQTNASPTDQSTIYGMMKVNNNSPLPALVSPRIQQFSACYDRYPKPGSYGSLQVFPMNTVNTEMNSTEPTTEHVFTIRPPNPKSSISELQLQLEHIERIQEQEVSAKDHERLDEILKMCADFELHNQDGQNCSRLLSPVVQNRIKTNGSLPRDQSAFSLKCVSSENGTNSLYDDQLQPKRTVAYENVNIQPGNHVQLNAISPSGGYENVSSSKKPGYVPQSPRNRIKTCVSPKKDVSSPKKVEYDLLVQSFEEKLLMEIQLLRDRNQLNNGQPYVSNMDPSTVANSDDKRILNVNNLKLIIKKDIAIKQCDQLVSDRKTILGRIRETKAHISDIQRQEGEVIREVSTVILRSEQSNIDMVLV